MPGTLLVSVVAIVGVGLTVLGGLAWLRLGEYKRARRRGRPEDECSLQRYQPMARLLAGEDVDALRRDASCPKVAARWERSRRRILRLYLKELAVDFNRLHAEARILVAESPEQYSVLVPVLAKQQFAFWRALMMIELRLSLGGLNLAPASVEKLIATIDAMQREMARLAAPSAA
jgi:hypothetical protein